MIAELVRLTCEIDAHETLVTGDVESSVAAYLDFDPELMILDVMFKPGGGAAQILSKLDGLGGTRECAVIIVTGGVVEREAPGLRHQERVKHVIRKPFNVDDLRNAVRQVFGMPPVAPKDAPQADRSDEGRTSMGQDSESQGAENPNAGKPNGGKPNASN